MWEASAAENPARGMSGAGRVAQERAAAPAPILGAREVQPRAPAPALAPAVAEVWLGPQRGRIAAA